ncbi:Uncharacterized protein FKW44_018278, partial [Caligus rogercresseyi]
LEPGASPRLLEETSSRESTPSTSLNQSAFYSIGSPFQEEDPAYSSEALQFSLKDPTQLGRLWAEVIHPESGVYVLDGGQFSGHDLTKVWDQNRPSLLGKPSWTHDSWWTNSGERFLHGQKPSTDP